MRHAEALCAEKGEYTGVREARKHIAWYLKGVRGSARIRAATNTVESLDEIRSLLDDLSRSLE